MERVAVIVETRKHKALQFVLNNFMSNLPNDWKLQIFHGRDNSDYVSEVVKSNKILNDRVVYLNDLNVSELDHDSFVELFTLAFVPFYCFFKSFPEIVLGFPC